MGVLLVEHGVGGVRDEPVVARVRVSGLTYSGSLGYPQVFGVGESGVFVKRLASVEQRAGAQPL